MAALGSDWRIDEIFAVKPPYQWTEESSARGGLQDDV